MRKLLVAIAVLLAPVVALAQSPSNSFGLDLTANNTLAVSAAGHARLRFNSGTGFLEMSLAGAAYATVGGVQTLLSTYAAGASSADSIMTLDSTRGPVVVKDSSPSSGSPLFAVQNNSAASFLSITPSGQQFIRSGAADGASAVGLAADTFNAWSNATSKPFRVLTGGSERFSVTGPGNVNLIANASIVGASASTNTVGLTITPNVADGASSIALKINNTTALANATSSLLTLASNSVNRASFRPFSSDGFSLADGNGTDHVDVSTANGGISLVVGGGSLSVTTTSTNLTPNNGVVDVNAELMPHADATTGLTVGDASTRWNGMFSVAYSAKAASAQTAATQAWRDSANNAHFGVDSAGLPSLGSRTEWRENWTMGQTLAAATTAAITGGNWTYATSANATGFTNTTGVGLTGSSFATALTFGGGTLNGNSSRITTTAGFVDLNAVTNLYFVMEFPAALGVIGANNVTVRFGATNGAISATHPGGFYFQKASTDTNWQCVTDDGATTSTTNSNVAPVASTTQILRMEFYGSGTVLAAKTVKFYVNSTLVCTNTNNVYSASHVFPQFYNTTTVAGPITQVSAVIGPTLMMFNEIASPLIP